MRVSTNTIKNNGAIAEEDQGEPFGFATVSHSRTLHRSTPSSIGELATSENAEGRRVGSALVKACEQWAARQGYSVLTLTTGAGNTRALRFFFMSISFSQRRCHVDKLLLIAYPLYQTMPPNKAFSRQVGIAVFTGDFSRRVYTAPESESSPCLHAKV